MDMYMIQNQYLKILKNLEKKVEYLHQVQVVVLMKNQ